MSLAMSSDDVLHEIKHGVVSKIANNDRHSKVIAHYKSPGQCKTIV